MITFLIGENSFEIERELKRLTDEFDGRVERIDGSTLELARLPDLFMGQSLFATKRLVVIKNLSENKSVWAELPIWLGRVSDEIHLVLVEPTPDKRTKAYKELQRIGTVKEFKLWEERDRGMHEKWAVQEAKSQGLELASGHAHVLLERTGSDQWQVFHALEKLAVLERITDDTIENIIPTSPTENIFQLFEVALKGDAGKLEQVMQTLEINEDPYQVFGLLSTQAFQLAVLTVAEKPSSEVAKDIGAHPFVLQKLTPHAKRLGKTGARKVVAAFTEADAGMKTSVADPWLLIERALMKIAQI